MSPLYWGGLRPPKWFTRELSEGDSGLDVKAVQAILGLEQTGTFDYTTASFVRGLQRKAGLSMTGKVDKHTAKKLGDRSTKDLKPSWHERDVHLRDIGDDVRRLNELLGEREGDVYTAQTEAHVRRLQSEHGLPTTGVVDAATAHIIGD